MAGFVVCASCGTQIKAGREYCLRCGEQLPPEDAPRITQELLRRGYRDSEIRGILGENWLRVCRTVWK